MNNLSNSVDEVVECPLCMEPLEVDDLNFFPCTCGYQICRFCWHRIRTDENELCPACRKEYPENPADFKPLTQEEMIAFKSQKRQRDQQRKQKVAENRKHLANVRVVQKNLVFVVGLPPRLADADILKKHEYFGKYGKIHKVVINPSTTYAGIQGPSASAYVTYIHNADALRAIQSVNNVMIDGRLIKTSLGTTKYCSHFMKNQQCPKVDCMYLHELGDPEASFTKEEMHQGKHQEYEKRLHDVLIASTTGCGIIVGSSSTLSNIKNSEGSKINGISSNAALPSSTSASSCIINSLPSTAVSCTPKKEAWPSLSISPVNRNDSSSSNGNKNKKERTKSDKNKIDKNCRSKNNKNNTNTNLNPLPNEVDSHATVENQSTDNDFLYEQTSKLKDDKKKERSLHNLVNRPNQKKELCMQTTTEKERPFCNISDSVTSTSLKLDSDKDEYLSRKIRNDSNVTKIDNQRFPSFSNNSSFVIATSENNSLVSESNCGQSSLDSCNDTNANNERVKSPLKCTRSSTSTSKLVYENESENAITNLSEVISKSYVDELFRKNENTELKMQKDSINNMAKSVYIKEHPDNNRYEINYNKLVRKENNGDDYITDSMSSLNIFDENSIFSARTAILNPSEPLSFTHNEELISNQSCCTAAPNLPDLINGIDGYQNTTNEWEEALKNVMNKTSKQMEEQIQQNLQKRQQLPIQSHLKHHENDLQRFQELHKPAISVLNLGTSQLSGAQTVSDSQNCTKNYLIGPDFCRQSNYRQFQQSKESSNANGMQSSSFETNMSKFFDFHKHQQQKLQTNLHICGQNNIKGTVNENFHMMPTLEYNTLNSQLMDQSCSFTPQQHHQKLKAFGKIDGALCQTTLQQVSNHKISSIATQPNQYAQNMGCDDDLGFDPFIETQKALAELIDNDEDHNVGTTSLKLINHKGVNNVHQPHQQHMIEYMQRSRMPPPGFNHVNNFSGYGVVPKIQNSNVMSLMNLSTNNASSTGPHVQHPNHFPISSNAWGAQLGNYQQNLNDQQLQANSNQTLVSGNLKAYTGNDWTAMDPAILSFRQFSFPQQAPQIQPQQQELYLQQVAQHQQRTGFSSQSQHVTCLSNAVMSSQQNSQPHVNANVQGMLEYLKTRQFV